MVTWTRFDYDELLRERQGSARVAEKTASLVSILFGHAVFGPATLLTGYDALFGTGCACCRTISGVGALVFGLMWLAGFIVLYEKLVTRREAHCD